MTITDYENLTGTLSQEIKAAGGITDRNALLTVYAQHDNTLRKSADSQSGYQYAIESAAVRILSDIIVQESMKQAGWNLDGDTWHKA